MHVRRMCTGVDTGFVGIPRCQDLKSQYRDSNKCVLLAESLKTGAGSNCWDHRERQRPKEVRSSNRLDKRALGISMTVTRARLLIRTDCPPPPGQGRRAIVHFLSPRLFPLFTEFLCKSAYHGCAIAKSSTRRRPGSGLYRQPDEEGHVRVQLPAAQAAKSLVKSLPLLRVRSGGVYLGTIAMKNER